MRKLPVVGYEESYEVNENGDVYSIDRVVIGTDGIKYPFKGKLKSTQYNKTNGYLSLSLWKDNKETRQYTHRVVAEAFILNPGNKKQINHKDGNKLNNHVSNLEWVTHKENTIHAVNTGLKKYTNRLSRDQFIECLQDVIAGESYYSLSSRVPYKVPFLSVKLRRIAREEGIEGLLNESLREQKAERARVNGAKRYR